MQSFAYGVKYWHSVPKGILGGMHVIIISVSRSFAIPKAYLAALPRLQSHLLVAISFLSGWSNASSSQFGLFRALQGSE
jgi:hypothetical protein